MPTFIHLTNSSARHLDLSSNNNAPPQTSRAPLQSPKFHGCKKFKRHGRGKCEICYTGWFLKKNGTCAQVGQHYLALADHAVMCLNVVDFFKLLSLFFGSWRAGQTALNERSPRCQALPLPMRFPFALPLPFAIALTFTEPVAVRKPITISGEQSRLQWVLRSFFNDT